MSSVTFPTAIGGDGSTVTDDDNATTGLRNGGWRTRFIPCFTNLVNIANYVVTYTASTTAFATPPPIGSTTPNTGAFTRVTVTGSTAPANGMYLPGTNSLGFATNSSERVRIDASGNVGIGTSSPGAKLDVRATSFTPSSTSAAVLIEDKSAWVQGAQFYLNNAGTYNSSRPSGGIGPVNSNGMWYTAGALSSGNTSAANGFTAYATTASLYNQVLGNHDWFGDTGLTAGSTYTPTLKMRLDSSGNLGLGVTPSAWGTSSHKAFDIWTRTALANDSAGATQFINNGYYNGSNWIYKATAAASFYQQASGAHTWYNAPSGTAGNAISFTQAMTLDASGNLYINGTSRIGNAKISVYTASPEDGLAITSNGGASGTGYAYKSTSITGYAAFFTTSSGTAGSIYCNGTGTTYATSSDQRLKTNVAPADSAIQSILDFPVDQFDWISTGEHQDFGAVAQKAIKFIPEMVSVPEDPEAMWGIDWSKAVPRLIKTIQEMHQEIQTLKAKVNA